MVVGDVGLFVIQRLKLRDLDVKVVAILIEVAPGGRDIGFVLVVGVGYALRRWRATNRPGFEVTIYDGAIDSEEAGKVEPHPIDLVSGIYELLDGSYAIVREIFVIGERVKARAWPALVAATWRRPGVGTGDVDPLLCGVETDAFVVGMERGSKFRTKGRKAEGLLGRAQKGKHRKGSHYGDTAPVLSQQGEEQVEKGRLLTLKQEMGLCSKSAPGSLPTYIPS